MNACNRLRCIATCLAIAATVPLYAGTPMRISVSSSGKQSNGWTHVPTSLAGSRIVAFYGVPTNLIDNDPTRYESVFARDVWTGETFLVSVSNGGEKADDHSGWGLAAANGRYVVFGSLARNLVEHDTNHDQDVFLRDLATGETTLVSVNTAGEQANCASGGNSITPDGRFIAFSSCADNLTDDDDNGTTDLFLRDLEKGETTCIDFNYNGHVSKYGADGGYCTPDGRYVAFGSISRDLVSEEDEQKDDGYMDVFLRDMQTGKNVRISIGPDGQFANADSGGPAFPSPDGRYVVFLSDASNFGGGGWANVWLRDVQNETTELISVAADGGNPNADSHGIGGMSADCRFVMFWSRASNLTDEQDNNKRWDVFVRDRKIGKTFRVTHSYTGGDPNDNSFGGGISPNGRWVTFSSLATNIVKNDTNRVEDSFLIDFRGCDEFIRGDSDCNGAVNFNDIDAFIVALSDPGQFEVEHLSCDWQCNNDINGDQAVDFNDIDGFVECLINNGCP